MEKKSLFEFTDALGVTPKRFQVFASENRIANAPHHTQLIRFEAAIVSISKDPVKFRSEFTNALAEVLVAFAIWQEEGSHV